ncbi:MAG: hypothetical protein HY717_02595 [Planctomycetes bacterium]|nr:hypothetical protein [Planctomycetota bacterium]
MDISHDLHAHKTWLYAFEKQWLFYLLWGRLLYDPGAPEEVFAAAFERRYDNGAGGELGGTLLRAFKLASRMPLRLASFHSGTWDFTLYAEGFLAPVEARGKSDGASPFISIDELIEHQTLDPDYLSIPDFLDRLAAQEEVPGRLVTPLELAGLSEQDGAEVLQLIEPLRKEAGAFSGALECELFDLEAWAHLSLYFAKKLRAGVALAKFRRTGAQEDQETAVALLERAVQDWRRLSAVTGKHYRETPHPSGAGFIWEKYLDQVQRDVEIAREAGRKTGK